MVVRRTEKRGLKSERETRRSRREERKTEKDSVRGVCAQTARVENREKETEVEIERETEGRSETKEREMDEKRRFEGVAGGLWLGREVEEWGREWGGGVK